MNILLSTDNNYVMPTGVLMHSIGVNNGSDIHYHILINSDFEAINKECLSKIAYQYKNEIFFYTVNDSLTKELPFGKGNMPEGVTIATYYRLFITKLLPADIDRILYLDGDMIVRNSIESLYETNLDGYALAVVHDMDEIKHVSSERLPYPMKTGYFNAGMMLINLAYWRKNDAFGIFMDFIRNNGSCIIYHDQDVLNSVFYDKKKWLSVKYNFQNGFILKNNSINTYNPSITDDIKLNKTNPVIIHFSVGGPDHKPWFLFCFHPYRKEWLKYKAISQWKKQKLLPNEPDSFRRFIQRKLITLNLDWRKNEKYESVKLSGK